MSELLTPCLCYLPLQLDDWSFFLSLQQDPQVMLYVADPRPQATIREAFDSRLPPWAPGNEHWLCPVMRDRLVYIPLDPTDYQCHQRNIAEVGFLFAPAVQGRDYGYESLRTLCDYVFITGGVHCLIASIITGDKASKQLLLKIDFRLEGGLQENYWLNGRWHNDWLFGRPRGEGDTSQRIADHRLVAVRTRETSRPRFPRITRLSMPAHH